MLEDRCGLACTGQSCDEDVVSRFVDAETELEGSESALLADELDQWHELVRAVELERIWVLFAPQLFDRDAEAIGIDHERQATSVGRIKQPAVDVARVAAEIALIEEKCNLPAGRLERIGAVDQVLRDVKAEVSANGAGRCPARVEIGRASCRERVLVTERVVVDYMQAW